MNALALITVFSMMLVTSPALCMKGDKARTGSTNTEGKTEAKAPKKESALSSKRCGLLACACLALTAIACATSPSGSLIITEKFQPFVIDNNVYFDDRVHKSLEEFVYTPQAERLFRQYDSLYVHDMNTTVVSQLDPEDYVANMQKHAQKHSRYGESLALKEWCSWAREKFSGLFSRTRLVWRSIDPDAPEILRVNDACRTEPIPEPIEEELRAMGFGQPTHGLNQDQAR